MDELTEQYEYLHTPIYRPSILESLEATQDYFEVKNLESTKTREKNPHHGLEQNLL